MEEVNMSINSFDIALDDACFVARRVLAMLKDPRTNAERLGRVIDSIRTLAGMLHEAASDLFGDRGRIQSTSQAITVIGFNRLEALTRRFLYLEIERISQLSTQDLEPLPELMPALPAYEFMRVSSRYAAMA